MPVLPSPEPLLPGVLLLPQAPASPRCQVLRPCSLHLCAARAWRPRPSSETLTARLLGALAASCLPPPGCQAPSPYIKCLCCSTIGFSLLCHRYSASCLPQPGCHVLEPSMCLSCPALKIAAWAMAPAVSCPPWAEVPGPDTLSMCLSCPVNPIIPKPSPPGSWLLPPVACFGMGCRPALKSTGEGASSTRHPAAKPLQPH